MLTELEFTGYRPGVLVDVVGMHMSYYGSSWGFGIAFETKVASDLSEFLSRYVPERDLFLAVYYSNGEFVGSIILDCQDATWKGAHLHCFIVNQTLAGNGIGR